VNVCVIEVVEITVDTGLFWLEDVEDTAVELFLVKVEVKVWLGVVVATFLVVELFMDEFADVFVVDPFKEPFTEPLVVVFEEFVKFHVERFELELSEIFDVLTFKLSSGSTLPGKVESRTMPE
jgi:hypothetical protein